MQCVSFPLGGWLPVCSILYNIILLSVVHGELPVWIMCSFEEGCVNPFLPELNPHTKILQPCPPCSTLLCYIDTWPEQCIGRMGIWDLKMDRISADVVERVQLLTCVNHFLGKLLMLTCFVLWNGLPLSDERISNCNDGIWTCRCQWIGDDNIGIMMRNISFKVFPNSSSFISYASVALVRLN